LVIRIKRKILKSDMLFEKWFRNLIMRRKLSFRHPENLPISWTNVTVEAVKYESLNKLGEVIRDLKLSGI
jgi:hypothetical protein